jgi:hypothetical protein
MNKCINNLKIIKLKKIEAEMVYPDSILYIRSGENYLPPLNLEFFPHNMGYNTLLPDKDVVMVT